MSLPNYKKTLARRGGKVYNIIRGDFMKIENLKNPSLAVGIDIGTTTICASVYDMESKTELESISEAHDFYVSRGVFCEEDVSLILKKAEKILYEILSKYQGVISIGITGQMHGIVYVNEKGDAVSNLITWQDTRGDALLASGKTACEEIFELSGEKASTGYGVATHYYNLKNGLVPKDAVRFVSIMDLFAMKICGLEKAPTHASIGASFGLFDLEKGEFMQGKLSKLGIDTSFLPRVTSKSAIIGKCQGIDVSVPIGDNQASFLGSVGLKNNCALVNFGTGSQISAVSDFHSVNSALELRPYVEGKYLICGSSLCGGYAYSMLERFFSSYAEKLGVTTSQYSVMNSLAKEAYESGREGMDVNTAFLGKRSEPSVRGSIKNIGKENFTPAELVLGVLKGMVNELYELYGLFPEKRENIVASGGAVKKNEILKRLICDIFENEISVSASNEEAAVGAAIFSLISTGKIKYE